MDKKRQIIEDLIGGFFKEKTIDETEIFEETNLILGYFNKTLDEKEIEKIESRISSDDEFRFRLEMIKYETSKQLPKYRLIRLMMIIKSAKDWFFEGLKSLKPESSNFGIGATKSGSYLQLKYFIPVTLTATSVIIISLYLPFTSSYSITELSSSRSFFIKNTWRGQEEYKEFDPIAPSIELSGDILSLNWESTNINTDNFHLEINDSTYNTDENYLSIDNYQLEKDTLYINITEFFGAQPISKFSGVYLLSK